NLTNLNLGGASPTYKSVGSIKLKNCYIYIMNTLWAEQNDIYWENDELKTYAVGSAPTVLLESCIQCSLNNLNISAGNLVFDSVPSSSPKTDYYFNKYMQYNTTNGIYFGQSNARIVATNGALVLSNDSYSLQEGVECTFGSSLTIKTLEVGVDTAFVSGITLTNCTRERTNVTDDFYSSTEVEKIIPTSATSSYSFYVGGIQSYMNKLGKPYSNTIFVSIFVKADSNTEITLNRKPGSTTSESSRKYIKNNKYFKNFISSSDSKVQNEWRVLTLPIICTSENISIQLDIVGTGNVYLKAITFGLSDIYHKTPVIGTRGILNETTTLSINSLDTPYYTRKMEEEGIYEDFVDYMDSLNTNPLTRPSEPQPSERLLEFAKRYNIN
ncbi:MAG: hypothetical protein ACRC45_02565, partial [Cetobacterium sp.]